MDRFTPDRRALLAAAAALPLAACASTRASSPRATTMRVATFNIWHDMGDWPARLPLLVQALRDTDADVIALQEVLQDADKGLPNQAETLAAALGGYSARFSSVDREGARRRYGNAILSRLPAIDAAWKKLEPLDDYRTALRIRVDLGGHSVDVLNTHLAHQADAGPVRARQIADMLGWLPQDDTPLVVMGDFNAPLTDQSVATLRARGMDTALPEGAVPTTLNPSKGHAPRVIDHIFVDRRRFAVSGAHIIGETPSNGEYPSDHFGVTATLALR